MVVWLPDVDDKLDVTTEDPVVPPIAVWLLDVGDMMVGARLDVLLVPSVVEKDGATLEVVVVSCTAVWLLEVADERVGIA